MKRVICSDFFDTNYSEKFSFDNNQIHVPKRMLNNRNSKILLTIEDTEGNVLLKPTYLTEYARDSLFRYLPSWGLKIVKTIAGIPNVWVVDYHKVEL